MLATEHAKQILIVDRDVAAVEALRQDVYKRQIVYSSAIKRSTLRM